MWQPHFFRVIKMNETCGSLTALAPARNRPLVRPDATKEEERLRRKGNSTKTQQLQNAHPSLAQKQLKNWKVSLTDLQRQPPLRSPLPCRTKSPYQLAPPSSVTASATQASSMTATQTRLPWNPWTIPKTPPLTYTSKKGGRSTPLPGRSLLSCLLS